MANKSTDQSTGGAGTAQSDGKQNSSQEQEAARLAAEEQARLAAEADAAAKKIREDDEKAAAAAADAKKAEAAGLVPMTKAGDVLDVHPSCVADHKSAGWKVVE